MVDQGLEIPQTQDAPWSSYTRNGRPPEFPPVVPYNESPSDYDIPSTSYDNGLSTPKAYHPKDHIRVSSEEGLNLLRESPFAVLASVLARSATAWAQVLNFVESDIDSCQIHGPSTADTLGLALEQLKFNSGFLAHAQRCLRDNVYLIERRGCPNWPGQELYEPGTEGGRLASSLLTDHHYLIERCSELLRQCESNSETLTDTIKVIEARKSLNQTQQIDRLTRLALLFVPLSFIASIFGMNVDSFKNDPPIWVFVAIALPITTVTFLLLHWPHPFTKVLLMFRSGA